MLQIGPHIIEGKAVLAPMAGVTDAPFRQICHAHGAGLVTSEMITSDVTLWESSKSQSRLHMAKGCKPISVQIAGSDPEQLANAAEACVERGAQIVDINMGCPAKKVCKKLAGSALLRDEKLVANILESVVSKVDVPVTLKTRTGWDINNKNGKRIARLAESAGIQALTVHGRTRACRFLGNAEYDTIADIVQSVDIPVIANGDIDTAEKAKAVLEHTQASAVMIGRAALGNPWIFNEINTFLQQKSIPSRPSLSAFFKVIRTHLTELHDFYGEARGARIARKHFAWYCERIPYSQSDVRIAIKEFNTLKTLQSQLKAVQLLHEQLITNEEKAA